MVRKEHNCLLVTVDGEFRILKKLERGSWEVTTNKNL